MQLVCSVYVLTNVGDLAKICKFAGDLFQLSRHIFRLVVRNTEIFIGKQVCQTRDLLQAKQLVPVHSYVFHNPLVGHTGTVQFGNDVAHQLDVMRLSLIHI